MLASPVFLKIPLYHPELVAAGTTIQHYSVCDIQTSTPIPATCSTHYHKIQVKVLSNMSCSTFHSDSKSWHRSKETGGALSSQEHTQNILSQNIALSTSQWLSTKVETVQTSGVQYSTSVNPELLVPIHGTWLLNKNRDVDNDVNVSQGYFGHSFLCLTFQASYNIYTEVFMALTKSIRKVISPVRFL